MGDAWAVRRLSGDDWGLHRAVRLAMLLDQPDAYGSTFAREVAFDEATWRERLGHPVLIAESDAGLPLGVATLFRPDASHAPEIVAMWVAGHARGDGIADALVEACVDLARERGDSVVRLHVMRDNRRAVAFYERVGFAFDGSPGDIDGCDRMSRVLTA
ncbi:GNAT family N-acetyltransferase [Janibacter limosus]|jgi:ribosomal protein S18 acetylase RimI-like enzyme|uniref:GNAT family N-acetyltransferase n=1 Tax=Janibacter limosus TaxID=53458 RepID=UPI000835FC54|nr:GNAT family N-acetyltransferase [Janibacter limosus]